MVDDAKPDIVAYETLLKSSIGGSEFMPPGYSPSFRNDIVDGYGGILIVELPQDIYIYV